MNAAEHQPDPTKNDRPCIQDLVVADIEARKEVGVERYGTVLQPFNGRSALWDAYQEAIDLCQYLRQLIYEAEHKRDIEAAFRAGYHCRWHKEQGAYCFDPTMSPGDPEGAFKAWILE